MSKGCPSGAGRGTVCVSACVRVRQRALCLCLPAPSAVAVTAWTRCCYGNSIAAALMLGWSHVISWLKLDGKKEEPCNTVIWIKEQGAGALIKDGWNEKLEEKGLTKHLQGSCRDLTGTARDRGEKSDLLSIAWKTSVDCLNEHFSQRSGLFRRLKSHSEMWTWATEAQRLIWKHGVLYTFRGSYKNSYLILSIFFIFILVAITDPAPPAFPVCVAQYLMYYLFSISLYIHSRFISVLEACKNLIPACCCET